MTLSGKQIDYLNIGLMIISFILAVKLPFQVFLMSYAILGPLHYLTEIGWLDQRNYFSKNKRDAWILVALCAFVTVAFALYEIGNYGWGERILKNMEGTWFEELGAFFKKWEKSFIFLAFVSGLVMVFIKKKCLEICRNCCRSSPCILDS